MRPADGGEQEWIRLRRDDAAKARVNGHREDLRFFGDGAFLVPRRAVCKQSAYFSRIRNSHSSRIIHV